MANLSKNSSNNPIYPTLMFGAVWALLQTARVLAFPTIQGILGGNTAVEWLYPSLIDMLIGLSAPVIAFFIWKKNGLWYRLTPLIWFAVSFLEHVETIALNLISVKPHAFWGTTQSTITLELALFALLDAIALVILWQQMLRENPADLANVREKSRVMGYCGIHHPRATNFWRRNNPKAQQRHVPWHSGNH